MKNQTLKMMALFLWSVPAAVFILTSLRSEICAADGFSFSLQEDFRQDVRSRLSDTAAGDIERDIRALLRNPADTAVRARLEALCQLGRLASARQRPLNRFLDLVAYLSFLDEKLSNLLRENEKLSNFIRRHDRAPQEAADVGPLTPNHFEKADGRRGMGALSEIRPLYLDGLNKHLEKRKDAALRTLGRLREHHARLWAITQKTVLRVRQRHHDGERVALFGQIQELKNQLNEKDRAQLQQRRLSDVLSEQLRDARGKLDQMQARVASADDKIHSLTRDLASLTLENYEKNQLLANRNLHAREVEAQLTDTLERLNLVSRIIREKDTRIRSLQAEVMLLEFNSRRGTPTGSHDDRLVYLEAEIRKMNRRYQKARRILGQKNTEVDGLKEKLKDRETTIADFRAAFRRQEQRIAELSGIVDIYSVRLQETQKRLFLQDKILGQIEDRLGALPAVEKQRMFDRESPLPLRRPFLDDALSHSFAFGER